MNQTKPIAENTLISLQNKFGVAKRFEIARRNVAYQALKIDESYLNAR